MDQELYFSPAAERNRAPICEALRPLVATLLTDTERADPQVVRALELASGSGQHAAYLAAQLPELNVYPTDLTLERAASVAQWAFNAGVSSRVTPLRTLDASAPESWFDEGAESATAPNLDLVYCANMIHISPWPATRGLFAGAGMYLRPSGYLVTYGPYHFDPTPLAPSNVAFDEQLRARNPHWGIRSITALDALAAHAGLKRVQTHALPAQNHLLVYQR